MLPLHCTLASTQCPDVRATELSVYGILIAITIIVEYHFHGGSDTHQVFHIRVTSLSSQDFFDEPVLDDGVVVVDFPFQDELPLVQTI